MKKFYFNLDPLCNCNCWHCFVDKIGACLTLTTDEIKTILNDVKQQGVEIVALTGGEPTIRKDFFEIIDFCKKLKFNKIELQTNGRMFIDKTFAKKTVDHGVTDIYLSFHAHTEALQDFITRTKGSFKDSLEGLKNLLDLDVRLQTNTVISKLNYKILDKLIIFFHEKGVREVELDFLRPTGNAWIYFDMIVPRKSDVNSYVETSLEIAESLGFDTIFVDDYPLCFMKKFKQYNADYLAMLQGLKQHDEQAFTLKRPELGLMEIHENQKLKGSPCKQCSFNAHCEGDWKEYIQKFGWNEFIPIENNI